MDVSDHATLADIKRAAIEARLAAHEWRLADTAHSLGIGRATLWRLIRRYGLVRVVRHNNPRSQRVADAMERCGLAAEATP